MTKRSFSTQHMLRNQNIILGFTYILEYLILFRLSIRPEQLLWCIKVRMAEWPALRKYNINTQCSNFKTCSRIKENIEYWTPKNAGQANKIGLGHKKDISFYDHCSEWGCFILFGD